ncbi:MAG: LptF/LptG family permease [Candidatus Omnitrophota bacterium]|jgi:lipopolysaccharide export system permease protein
MHIIDRHIIKSVIFIFIVTFFTFGLLFVLVDSASNLDEFIGQKVSIQVLFQYYLAYLPVVLVQTTPMALLISVLLTYSTLNAHNEVVVLRASGMNFWQITRPALGFVAVMAALMFFINERYIPQAEEKTKKIKNENLILEVDRKKKKLATIKNLTFYGLKNRLYFIDTFDPNTYDLEGLTVIEYDQQQNIKEKLVALKGAWTGIAWKCFQCHVTHFPADPQSTIKVKVYEDKLLDIKETPEDFLNQRLTVTAMNIRQLTDYIGRFANSGAKRALNNLKVDLYQKYSFPLTNIIIVLVGLPLTLSTGRRSAQTFSSLGIAIGIGFLYYVTNAVGLALGKGGIFPPLLSAWMAPVLFTGVALYLIKYKFR